MVQLELGLPYDLYLPTSQDIQTYGVGKNFIILSGPRSIFDFPNF